MIPVPDVLHHEPRLAVDQKVLKDLLGLGFLGKEVGNTLDEALARGSGGRRDGWRAEFFVEDLFLDELIRDAFTLELDGEAYAVQKGFLARELADPPLDVAGIRFRQEILEELSSDAGVRARTERLYRELQVLLSMFKLPGLAASLDLNAFRLDVLRQSKKVMDRLVDDFGGALSGLRRLHDVGLEIRASPEYATLAALLDHENRLASLSVEIRVGATGKISHLEVVAARENRRNPFYRSPWRRWVDRVRLAWWRGYKLDEEEIVSRLLQDVFFDIVAALVPMVQLIGQLEVYLTSLQHAERTRALGLGACLARFDGGGLELEGLYNPLLLRQERLPVPCSIRTESAEAVVLVTGPNSGGKTRLLQALGLAQLLGQSGLYAPAERAHLKPVRGMFASLLEREAVDQTEGHLGQELRRLRVMFEAMETPSMVVFDELCAGTNPSEGIEVFTHVLRLLETLRPLGFVTTHFLDFARDLAARPPVEGLEFLQVEVDEGQHSTYQFVPGVATTSLAAVMARRLGVTFEELSAKIHGRRNDTED